MKYISFLRIGILPVFAVCASIAPLRAAGIEVPWNQVCRVADGRQLAITTSSGETIEGYCKTIGVADISIETKDKGIVKVARIALEHIKMRNSKGHQLRSLAKGMQESFHQSSNMLLSPYAPAGIVLAPGTMAWGVIAAPFCLLGDLKYKLSGEREIKVR